MTKTTTQTICDLCRTPLAVAETVTTVSRVVPYIENGVRVGGLCASQKGIDLCETCARGTAISTLFDGVAKPEPSKETP